MAFVCLFDGDHTQCLFDGDHTQASLLVEWGTMLRVQIENRPTTHKASVLHTVLWLSPRKGSYSNKYHENKSKAKMKAFIKRKMANIIQAGHNHTPEKNVRGGNK